MTGQNKKPISGDNLSQIDEKTLDDDYSTSQEEKL